MTETALTARWLETHVPPIPQRSAPSPSGPSAAPDAPNKYNRNKDRAACSYPHNMAADGKIELIEVGAAGQKFADRAKRSCETDNTVPDTGRGTYLRVKRTSDDAPDLSDASTFLLMKTGGLAGCTTDGTAGTNFDEAHGQLCDYALTPLPPGDVVPGPFTSALPWWTPEGIELPGRVLSVLGVQAPTLHPESLAPIEVRRTAQRA
ncbi:hypothetical protein WJ438_04420 [Streptomyces sp. GD-15H]|uniref:hypothetical protein n=1 Tax=Streptomyces sp. GD-15H TaxID=3129112 RepID=UPI0032522D47